MKKSILRFFRENGQMTFKLVCMTAYTTTGLDDVYDSDNVRVRIYPVPANKAMIIINEEDIEEHINEAIKLYYLALENIRLQGSVWRFAGFVEIILNLSRYKPIKGKSYIKVPEWV